ncbi:unnamed protein product [Acanthoscelides obtectus]|uniref:Uncharacterized protein n=1 Tax=Acanthoscelides obtectus TaxID=200917 RepID=A0A9P0P080_ACAOB|nr:unnamed protein product [Acanthoscelides obtectus]CAK1632601.1 hypothetical protein AOBTE_LOCUS7643 [Acanthoscelides obtectus]
MSVDSSQLKAKNGDNFTLLIICDFIMRFILLCYHKSYFKCSFEILRYTFVVTSRFIQSHALE